ncbi:NAC domain-containing protein 45 [Linum grandiflorum]
MRIPSAPVGFRFRPSGEEIIEYLLKTVTGNALPEVFFECDLYSEDEVWKSLFLETKASELYVFTKLPKKTGQKRAVRTVGMKATWRSSADNKVTTWDGVHIGSKRTFSYLAKSGGSLGFLMDEYRLDGVLGVVHPAEGESVICCIRKDSKSSGDA